MSEQPAPDRNVEAVVGRLRERSRAGLAKYGVTTERGDLTLVQWLQHLQEELLDAAIYVERVKGDSSTPEGGFIKTSHELLAKLEAVADGGVPVLEVMVRRDPPLYEREVVFTARIDRSRGRDYGWESLEGISHPVAVIVRSREADLRGWWECPAGHQFTANVGKCLDCGSVLTHKKRESGQGGAGGAASPPAGATESAQLEEAKAGLAS